MIQEQKIISQYTKNDQGIVVGYKLYNRLGLTTQISKKTEIISNLISMPTQINNIYIRKPPMKITKNNILLLELLDVLSNYDKIEDLNDAAFRKYVCNTVNSLLYYS